MIPDSPPDADGKAGGKAGSPTTGAAPSLPAITAPRASPVPRWSPIGEPGAAGCDTPLRGAAAAAAPAACAPHDAPAWKDSEAASPSEPPAGDAPTPLRQRLWWLPWRTLMGQFFLVSAVLLLHSMLAQGAWVALTIETEAKRYAAGAASLFIEHFIAPHLIGPTPGSITPEQAQAIAGAMQQASVHMRVLALKLWSPDGRILYATDPTLVGRQFPLSNALRISRAGGIVAEFDQLDEPENANERGAGVSLLEIYVPVRDRSGGVVAVVEFYENATALRQHLAVAKRNAWLVAALISLFVVAGLSVIFARAAKVIGRQQRALVEKVRQTSQALRRNMVLQARVERASRLAAEENERFLLSLGADLHDGAAQLIGYALLRLDALAPAAPKGAGEASATAAGASEDLVSIRGALADAMNEVRNVCAGLSMPEIETLSLGGALACTIADHERRTRTSVESAIGANLPAGVPHFVKVCLCRFVQEALTNAFRHAGGKGQVVEAWVESGTVWVQVRDSGPGIAATLAGSQRTRLGLAGLTNRIESWGGTVDVASVAGGGTSLTASMQIATEREELTA